MQNKKIIRYTLSYIKKEWVLITISLLLACITVASTLSLPLFIGRAIDCIVGVKNVDFSALYDVLFLIGIMILITIISQWLMGICNNRITFRVGNRIRIEAFEHIQKLPVSYVDSSKHGDIVSRIIVDIEQFSDGLLMGFTQFFTGIITILGTLVVMFVTNVTIALVVVVITPLSIFVANFIAKNTYKMFTLQAGSKGELTAYINEIIGQLKLVRAFEYSDTANEKFDITNEQLRKHSTMAIFFSSVIMPATRFVNGLVYAAVAVFGAISAINGVLSVGQITSFLSYANQYTKPFNEISGVISELQNALACAGRVFELINEETISDNYEEKSKYTDGDVEFDNISFSYYEGQNLIKDLSIKVKQGQRIAIVGPTGCGKSTLINLLMRFYDVQRGEINIGSGNIYNYSRETLRENIGMVLQDTWLKTGTIRENIAYGNPNATMEEVIKASKEAYAHSFIKKLNKGYDTVISENGGDLSQGEKQLICIARVMLLLPPMLILDEATSSIDTRIEIKIQEAFNKMMAGRTSFVVAHRLSTIKNSDMILVMKDGTIIEQGTHRSLYDSRGFYYDMYAESM